MKKIIALLGVMLFCATTFALNAVAPVDEDCAAQKAAFEKNVASQANNYFIAQNILINLADPLEQMTDPQAQPLAACYATFEVKGVPFVDFVRAHQGEFRPNEANQLAVFAARVERLSKKAAFEQVVAQNNDYFIMLYVLDNIIAPMQQMSEPEAAAKAAEYKSYQVKGQPLSEFIRHQAAGFDMNVEIHLEDFADKIDPNN